MKYFDSHQVLAFQKQLIADCERMSIPLTDTQASSLITYLALLAKWNKTYNLTAVRQPDEMLSRHLVDSLSILPYATGDNILDVGTGPGLPGIPLAIMRPQQRFTLLDSNSKKTRFITQSVIELGLKNVSVCHARVEEARFKQSFDQVVSRAFTSLANMVELCSHQLSDSGQFLAMKGIAPTGETEQLGQQYQIEKTVKLEVPGCAAQRHLIIVKKRNN